MSKTIWASSSVQKPISSRGMSTRKVLPRKVKRKPSTHWAKVFQPPMKATNSRHRDTPVTMSAFIMGILPTVFNGSRQRRRMLNRPMVEMTVAKMAMSRVLDTASIIFLL